MQFLEYVRHLSPHVVVFNANLHDAEREACLEHGALLVRVEAVAICGDAEES